MIEIQILMVGKTKEPWVTQACEEYSKRLCPWGKIVFTTLKNDEQLIQAVGKLPNYCVLDVQGKQLSSEAFADYIGSEGARMTFVIGGPLGLPQGVVDGAAASISLSRMTYTHQTVRIVLVEQIYRAYTILKNLPYHK